jgi:protein-S-isoprenylcysteine O-methyltransferase Ste14
MRTGLKTAVSSLMGFVAFGLLLFLPAGTFDYWQAWAFLLTFALATIGPTVYLVVKDPEAVERRMRAGQESRPVQRVLVGLIFLLFPALLVYSALDHRFGWSPVPAVVSLIGDALIAVGLLATMVVVLQNRYAAANITVAEGQKVVTTGLYGVVRHPMYTAALIMMAGIPIALDAWWGLAAVPIVLAIFVLSIRDEVKVLRQELAGYSEYTEQTRHRLVPGVW